MTRDALYEGVWSKPGIELAAELGISGVALAKTCKKLDVPRTARGYWQQIEHGQKRRRTPLPKANARTRTEFVLR